jgi:hypothetical protein
MLKEKIMEIEILISRSKNERSRSKLAGFLKEFGWKFVVRVSKTSDDFHLIFSSRALLSFYLFKLNNASRNFFRSYHVKLERLGLGKIVKIHQNHQQE